MDNIKKDQYYVDKSIKNINKIEEYIDNLSYEDFVKDERNTDSIMFRLIQLVENLKCLSDAYKEAHSEIPWGEIMGFRNGIVHDYGATDYTIVYEIITIELKKLKLNLTVDY